MQSDLSSQNHSNILRNMAHRSHFRTYLWETIYYRKRKSLVEDDFNRMWGITKLTHIMGDDNARGDLSLEEDRDE